MAEQTDPLNWRRQARGEFRLWLVVAVGLVFAMVSLVTDPATNCAEGGDCAPWLVPLAGLFGGAMALAAAIALARNIERGSRLDRESGDLVWWQNRTRRSAGQGGRVALARIAEIRIDRSSDSDRLRLIDVDGRPVAGFDENSVPLPLRAWAEALTAHAPHICIVEVT